MSKSKLERLILPPDDAARIVLSEVLECEVRPKDWSTAFADTVSRDAQQIAGDKATPQAWLAQRAKLLLMRLKQKDHFALESAHNRDWLGRLLFLATLLLAVLGYCAGAMSDKLSSSGSYINLLAPPLMGLLLWNVLVYAALLAQAVLRALNVRFELPLQKALLRISSLFGAARLPGRAIQGAFFRAFLPYRTKSLSHRVRRACHIAALAFAVGILTSIAIRGIGSAFVVHWESTWFAGRADIVTPLIHTLYGLIPVELPSTAPLPDVQGVAALELTAPSLATASAGSGGAAPWLWRLIQTVFWWVLLPRTLLIVWESLSVRRADARVPLDVSTPYYRSLFAALSPKSAMHFMVDASLVTADSRWQLRDRLPLGLTQAVSAVHFWDTEADALIAAWDAHARVVPVFNAIHTPEDDVHGLWLKRLAEKLPSGFAVCVDFTEFDRRFGEDLARRSTRTALWEQFLVTYGARLIVLDEAITAEVFSELLNRSTSST